MQIDLQGAVSGFSTTVGGSNIGVSSMSRLLSNDNMLLREVGGRVSKTSTVLAQAWKEDTDPGNLLASLFELFGEKSLERWLMQLWRPICTVRNYIFIAQLIRSFRIALSPFLCCQHPNRCDLQLFPLALMTSSRFDIARSTWWP
ncbi:hypothetical protein PVK06_024130 [Gossypium arboreum]|uniref:Uncharacterized protein n=1 Tax=Gossypium arboreum TaxID=29729 RepID=A0ABR0PD43_GOSAR|nr:hypothetical protein PVK06_024130 [Gossypium arboreum]